eukprot:7900738-Ditylum_brightwellii.AAC.2
MMLKLYVLPGRMLEKHNSTENRHLQSSETKALVGKTFVRPMCQNSHTTVMCSSKKHPPIELSTVCCSNQKVPLESSAKGIISPRRLDFDNQTRKVVVDWSQGQRRNTSSHQSSKSQSI